MLKIFKIMNTYLQILATTKQTALKISRNRYAHKKLKLNVSQSEVNHNIVQNSYSLSIFFN